MNFNDKTIWITGASSGIGKAMALGFSKLGANLILSSRDTTALQQVKSSCDHPEKVFVLEMDLLKIGDMEQLVAKAMSFFGAIDILINNAGISQRSLASKTLPEVDRKIFDINYFGTIALTKALLPFFIDKKQGHIVTITSVVGKIGTPWRSSYSASKHALHGFFDSVRAELFKDNIDITLICPGFVKTNVSINALTADGKEQGTMDEATAKGLNPDLFAKKAIRSIYKKRQEVVIGGALEVFAVYVKRYFPLLLSKMLTKVKVT